MKELNTIIDCMEKTPFLLGEFLKDIPREELKMEKRQGKWSIHENACHLAHAEQMINSRFRKFLAETAPDFAPYLPGTTEPDNLITLDLDQELTVFADRRKDTVSLLKSFNDSDWENEATHPQYKKYNPKILARHTLMHDHHHMYTIEMLWLTKDRYL